MTEQFISVGRLGKPYGLRGAFRFLLYCELKSRKELPAHFLIKQGGSFVPWFTKETEWTGFDEGLVIFEEISSPEQARQYSSSELFLYRKDYARFFKKKTASFTYLIGFTAIDKEEGKLGIVEIISENPGQILCSVKRKSKAISIPLVNDFIIKIDKRKKEIFFDLPNGLLDL